MTRLQGARLTGDRYSTVAKAGVMKIAMRREHRERGKFTKKKHMVLGRFDWLNVILRKNMNIQEHNKLQCNNRMNINICVKLL